MDPTVLAVGNLKVLTGVGSLHLGADRSLLDNFGWRDSVLPAETALFIFKRDVRRSSGGLGKSLAGKEVVIVECGGSVVGVLTQLSRVSLLLSDSQQLEPGLQH